MKKLKSIIFVSLILLNNVISQDEKLVHYGFNVNPKWTIQNFENKTLGEESNSLSFSIGGEIYFAINHKIELKSGLNINQTYIEHKDYTVNFGSDFNGLELDNFKSYTEENYKILYLGIPIEGKFKIRGQENHVYFKVGFEPLFRFNNSSKMFLIESGRAARKINNNSIKLLNKTIFKIRNRI